MRSLADAIRVYSPDYVMRLTGFRAVVKISCCERFTCVFFVYIVMYCWHIGIESGKYRLMSDASGFLLISCSKRMSCRNRHIISERSYKFFSVWIIQLILCKKIIQYKKQSHTFKQNIIKQLPSALFHFPLKHDPQYNHRSVYSKYLFSRIKTPSYSSNTSSDIITQTMPTEDPIRIYAFLYLHPLPNGDRQLLTTTWSINEPSS